MAILPAASASGQPGENGNLAISSTYNSLRKVEPVEYFQSVIASIGYEVHHDDQRNRIAK